MTQVITGSAEQAPAIKSAQVADVSKWLGKRFFAQLTAIFAVALN